jgi:hypothetical protein
MKPSKFFIAPVALSAALVASAAIAGGLDAAKLRFTANLAGAAEVPGPGDADGKGKAILELDPSASRLCYKLRVEGIDTATMSHLHLGAVGVAGDAVVKFEPPAKGTSSGCAQMAPETTAAIVKDPDHYYVNVHNAAFPNGAVRGQLGK